jgi:hypothetical protein
LFRRSQSLAIGSYSLELLLFCILYRSLFLSSNLYHVEAETVLLILQLLFIDVTSNMASDDEFDDSELSGQDMINALENTERTFAIPQQQDVLPIATRKSTEFQPLDSSEPDFSDPSIISALNDAEVDATGLLSHSQPNTELIMLTRAQLDAIKRSAFTLGRKTAQKVGAPFPFLSLPAELRLIFYAYYFIDRNSVTGGRSASALPARISDPMHCCSANNTWCKTARPWVSTNLLVTCKQIYHEARDDFLYRGRRFKAQVGKFDMAMRPHLRFWQFIQHLDLQIDSDITRIARYETGNLIVHLVALLRGGQNLKSFKLKYMATRRIESITRFKDLSVKGSVSLTQVFKDWFEPDEGEELRRKERLERLLLSILGCACKLRLCILRGVCMLISISSI